MGAGTPRATPHPYFYQQSKQARTMAPLRLGCLSLCSPRAFCMWEQRQEKQPVLCKCLLKCDVFSRQMFQRWHGAEEGVRC